MIAAWTSICVLLGTADLKYLSAILASPSPIIVFSPRCGFRRDSQVRLKHIIPSDIMKIRCLRVETKARQPDGVARIRFSLIHSMRFPLPDSIDTLDSISRIAWLTARRIDNTQVGQHLPTQQSTRNCNLILCHPSCTAISVKYALIKLIRTPRPPSRRSHI